VTRGVRQPAIATGIFPDDLGFEVRVHVNGHRYSKRFPPNHPLELMQAWQNDERAYRLRCLADDEAERGTVERGTLAGDVQHYLQKRKGRPGYKSDRSHLKAWADVHGKKPRHKLLRHDCEKQIGVWLQAKKAPRTIRHRIRALKELWHALDGLRVRTPLDGIKLPRVPKTTPVPVGDDVIIKVADSLKAGLTIKKRCGPKRKLVTVRCHEAEKTYARFVVYALSGQRPSQIGRALPRHVDHGNRIWHVTAGKGGYPTSFPLTEALDLAFQYFDKVDAWGSFNTRSFSKTLRRHGWPATVRPYALRHTFAIGQLLAGVDLGDLQGLLGHTSPTTTRIYAPVLVARLKQAVEKRTLKLVSG
jgi:integrase